MTEHNCLDKRAVIESRKLDGAVFRRSKCHVCGKAFVTSESLVASNKLPPRVERNRELAAQRKADRAESSAVITGTGAHLQGIW